MAARTTAIGPVLAVHVLLLAVLGPGALGAVSPCQQGTTLYQGMNMAPPAVDLQSGPCPNVTTCSARCCEDPSCLSFTFTSSQPGAGTANCPGGKPCCWLKGVSNGTLSPEANCVSGIVPAKESCLNGTKIYPKTDWRGSADIAFGYAANASVCAARCCLNPACAAWTFTPSQPVQADQDGCPHGTPCCWQKAPGGHALPNAACCTSGTKPLPPPPPPGAYAKPNLTFAGLIARDPTGNLRDPSSVVQDPETGLWHFWVDFMPGPTTAGWHAAIHHYSAPNITGPWTSHGVALNHSTDPAAWDYSGTFSPSVLYSPGEAPALWYMFYSASGANQSSLETCAQLVASANHPHGPWYKLGAAATPTGSPSTTPPWGPQWNARRLDSGRALFVNGVRGYWTKGVSVRGGVEAAQEGLYLPANPKSFAPPFGEYGHNPVNPAATANPYGCENCEFYRGPDGEVPGRTTPLLHITCTWHDGTNPHYVADPLSGARSWTFVGNLTLPGEPTPVYEGAMPGDAATVNYFIARHDDGTAGPGALGIALYSLAWEMPPASA